MSSKTPRLTGHTFSANRLNKGLKKRLCVLRASRLNERGATPTSAVSIERKLAHREDRPADVQRREVHFASVILKDPQVGDLLSQRGGALSVINSFMYLYYFMILFGLARFFAQVIDKFQLMA